MSKIIKFMQWILETEIKLIVYVFNYWFKSEEHFTKGLFFFLFWIIGCGIILKPQAGIEYSFSMMIILSGVLFPLYGYFLENVEGEPDD